MAHLDRWAKAMRTLVCTLIAIAFASLRANDQWSRIEVGDVSIDVPAEWQKADVQGEDSVVVRYTHSDFTLEIEKGSVLLKSATAAAEEVAELESKRRDPLSLRDGEEIVEVGTRLGEVRAVAEDHHVAYAGFRRLVQLYLPLKEGGYVAVRVFHRDEAGASKAIEVIRSIKMKERSPNQSITDKPGLRPSVSDC